MRCCICICCAGDEMGNFCIFICPTAGVKKVRARGSCLEYGDAYEGACNKAGAAESRLLAEDGCGEDGIGNGGGSTAVAGADGVVVVSVVVVDMLPAEGGGAGDEIDVDRLVDVEAADMP